MIEHLVVVGGPSCAGKSTLIREMLSNRLPELRMRLGIDDKAEWQYVTGSSIRLYGGKAPVCHYFNWKSSSVSTITKLTLLPLKGLVVFQYDMTKIYRRKLAYNQDEALDVLREERSISFVTPWTPPKRFVRQRFQRDLEKIQKFPLPILHGTQLTIIFAMLQVLPRRLSRWGFDHLLSTKLGKRLLSRPSRQFLKKYFAFFGQPDTLVQCYRHWLEFCDQHVAKTRNHFIVEFDEKLKFYARDQWKNMVRIYL